MHTGGSGSAGPSSRYRRKSLTAAPEPIFPIDAWALRNWDGIAVLAVSAIIAAGFPFGARSVTEPAARAKRREKQTGRDSRNA